MCCVLCVVCCVFVRGYACVWPHIVVCWLCLCGGRYHVLLRCAAGGVVLVVGVLVVLLC